MMWGLEIQRNEDQYLPLINSELLLGVILFLLGLRIAIQKILAKYFLVRGSRPEQNRSSLEYSYFYHLSILILVLSDVNWNIFDLSIWLFSYACIGMLRKAVDIAAIQKESMLNDYAYNNEIITLLQASKVYGISLFFFSIAYFIWVTHSFSGIPIRITSLLLFPTVMLGVDSLFLYLGSLTTSQDILCHYNQNINDIPKAYKLELYHRFVSSAIRVVHFFTITRIFLRTFFEKFEFLDCMWILSVLNACYSSSAMLMKSISQYSSLKKLMKKMNFVFRRASSHPGQMCIICMQELLNCRKLASCGHHFHFKCLFQWIQTKSQCPICREPIKLN